MIYQIAGVLQEKETDFCVVDVGGVGYGAYVPLSTFEQLPERGQEARLHTYLYVREDQMTLFGFASRQERTAFEMLLGASGIGPRMALAALSTLAVPALARAIVTGDAATLSKIPGVGKRTAERISLDLKNKAALLVRPGEAPAPEAAPIVAPAGSAQDEAIRALVSLGATQAEAQDRVAEAVREADEGADVETLVAIAMRPKRRRETTKRD